MSAQSTDTDELTAKVEAILTRASSGRETPSDIDLVPVSNFLLQSDPATSSDLSTHWYCDKAKSKLHTRAASYLLFLFAFRREGDAKAWVESLESVLRGCEHCAKGFGIARRNFASTFMAYYPQPSQLNFFAVVDKWEIEYIHNEAHRASSQEDGSSAGTLSSLSSLSLPITQLVLSHPSLLDNAQISQLLDNTIANSTTIPISNVSNLGLTPGIARLLSSPKSERRAWALVQITGRRPLTFDDYIQNGVKDELEMLYIGGKPVKDEINWQAIATILQTRSLRPDAVEKGLLGGVDEDGKRRGGKGIMPILTPLLGAESQAFPYVLQTFASLLQICPTRSFWSFDTSPELPHTLFSDIKNNPSFRTLLENHFQRTTAGHSETKHASSPEKGKSSSRQEDPIAWITDLLNSLVDTSPATIGSHATYYRDTGFREALAKISGTCFQDFQHSRFSQQSRAGAAHACLESLGTLQRRLSRDEGAYRAAMSSALDIHSVFITTVALRPADHPSPIWDEARESALELLAKVFQSDAKDIIESMLGMSLIANEEKKRQIRAKKAKVKEEAPPKPIPVSKLHRASVHKELWSMAYNALSPTDATGASILVRSIATYAHVEKLNRHETWSYQELKLQDVVKEDEFVDAIRAINSSIQTSRDPFAHAMEALAMQTDPMIVKRLWDQADVPRSAIILLLSPAEDVHDPAISLIQQSFENVDDRGDCFRVLLRKYPAQAMDGLAHFLTQFIDTANITPESCSLAKWLVRCFTDVLDALCQPTEESEPLLQSSAFLSTFSDSLPMSRRVSNLWHLMTTSLAVIFKRTTEWAPLYDNETMVDWMRDALIFGRQMVEHIRAFESACLGVSGTTSRFTDNGESPAKPTKTGAKLVQKLETVLHDLVSWLRLTDVETLHQTFELIKTIVGRIAKNTPDVSQSPPLEKTLLDIDKFSRKASKSYRTRLSDDLLSELSDLLEPFNLAIVDDEVQYVKSTTATPRISETPATSTAPAAPPPRSKNAFDLMMRKVPGSSTSSTSKGKPTTTPARPKQEPIVIDDYDFDDDFLDKFSSKELDKIEKGVKVGTTPSATPSVRPASSNPSKVTTRPQSSAPSSSKLNINVVPKFNAAKIPSGSSFKSQVMRDLRREHRMESAERNRNIGGITAKVPAGSGLGAYQGPRRVVQEVESSGSSAAESSDGEHRGIGALAARQKSPKKTARMVPPPLERRTMKVLGTSMSDVIAQREQKRASQHALKQRLRPDLTTLHRYILAWSPEHTGDLAPQTRFASEIGQLGPVPTVFPSVERYRKVMLPLFLQELWAQCLKDNRTTAPIWVEISTRTYEDDFLDIELTVQGNVPPDFYVNETDVVVLRNNSAPGAKPVLAKVQGFKRKFRDIALKVRILGIMDQKDLSGRARWHLQKHVSLSTALREFGALQGLPYYEKSILSDVLAARSARIPRLYDEDVEEAMKAFDTNEPQARAILGAMSVEGFAMIQGPPGTGKTKTISGLVGKFISERDGAIHVHGLGEKPAKAKLLVCAPSNAAIDEVCKRLMNGVPSTSGTRLNPTIVRIGIDSSVNIAVKDVSLDSLVEARVNSETAGRDGGGDYSRIQSELEEVKRQINAKQDEIQKAQNHDEQRRKLENEYQTLIQKRTQLGQQSSKAKDAARDATRHLEGARRAAREAILKEADIICATLSGAGHESLAPFTFETVIIDEAAQAIEMSCLIPLKYGCKRCIMVGDPHQLPPTTFSSEAEKYHYNQSLFVRIAHQSPANVQLLSIQYRMNPFISELPSKVFYQGRLKDGENMAAKTAAIWHERSIFGPYRFFNVEGVESRTGTSTKNTHEALVAVELYRRLEEDFGLRVNFAMRIGVISMYKEQLWELKRKFTEAFGAAILDRIEFNTVDGFQGQEKDIIILSCVRSGPGLRTIGFLKDPRRMNVALTRAKSSLFVIGNGPTLERSDERWKTIVGDARERGFFINYGPTTFAPEIEVSPQKKVKKERPASPHTSKTARSTEPPQSLMDEAKPLKRKSNPDLRGEGERKKKRKKEKREEKRKRLEASGGRSSSPVSVASSSGASSVKVESRPRPSAPARVPNGHPPPPPSTMPPPLPPPPSAPQSIPLAAVPPSVAQPPRALPLGPPRGPPPAPPRAPEDSLFIKRKKKPLPGSIAQNAAGLPHARAAINDRLHGRR